MEAHAAVTCRRSSLQGRIRLISSCCKLSQTLEGAFPRSAHAPFSPHSMLVGTKRSYIVGPEVGSCQVEFLRRRRRVPSMCLASLRRKPSGLPRAGAILAISRRKDFLLTCSAIPTDGPLFSTHERIRYGMHWIKPSGQDTFGKNKAARATVARELDLMQCSEVVSHIQSGPVPRSRGNPRRTRAVWQLGNSRPAEDMAK